MFWNGKIQNQIHIFMFGKNFFFIFNQYLSIDFEEFMKKMMMMITEPKYKRQKSKIKMPQRKKNRKHLKNGLNSMKKEWKIHKVEHIMFVELEKWKKKQNLKTRIFLSDSSNVSGTIVASILN